MSDRTVLRLDPSGALALLLRSQIYPNSNLSIKKPHKNYSFRQLPSASISTLTIWRCEDVSFGSEHQRITGGRIRFPAMPSRNQHVLSARKDHYRLSYEDSPQELFHLSLMKEAIWAVKSLFLFLVEQSSQLKYIEWPGFQSTLKTATLTLVIVALLIVALSSVDSILCYLLALLLRRTA